MLFLTELRQGFTQTSVRRCCVVTFRIVAVIFLVSVCLLFFLRVILVGVLTGLSVGSSWSFIFFGGEGGGGYALPQPQVFRTALLKCGRKRNLLLEMCVVPKRYGGRGSDGWV